MVFKKLNRPLLKPNSNLKHTPRGEYIPPQYLIWASIPKTSTPYLLVKGDVSIGDYKIIAYATEEEARNRQEQEGGLARILKAFPIRKIKPRLKNIEGFAVYRTTDKDYDLFTILSQDDVFLGSNPEIQLKNAMKRKKKYTANLKGEKNPIYGMFRDDQVIISALVPVD